MGNIIRFNEHTPVDDWICMSNATTDVFINDTDTIQIQIYPLYIDKPSVCMITYNNKLAAANI